MKVYNNPFSGDIVSRDAGNSDISKNGFYKVLAAELQNQDPTSGGDSTQYIAQMAQFTSLEQMVNLNTAMQQLLVSQKFQEGSLMIGKIAKVYVDEDNYITGEVTGARLGDNSINIIIDGKECSMEDVVELTAKTEEVSVPPENAETDVPAEDEVSTDTTSEQTDVTGEGSGGESVIQDN